MGIVIKGPWKAPSENSKFIAIRQMIDHELDVIDRLAEEAKETAKPTQSTGGSKR